MFTGFSPEMPEFLFALRFCNTIDMQSANIEKYKKLISEPLRQLYLDLAERVSALDPSLEMRPARCISTPYTDRRFSPHVPLKEYMYIRFKQADKKENIVGFYFDMGAEDYSYGLRIYKQNARGMAELREKIEKAPAKFSEALDSLLKNGFEVSGESYKTDRCPHLPPSSAKDLYNRKGFYIGKDVPVNPCVFSAALAEEIMAGFAQVNVLRCLL